MSNDENVNVDQIETTVVSVTAKPKQTNDDITLSDDSLQLWLDEKQIEDFTIRVYKTIDGRKKEFMVEFDGRIPTETEIGLSFGSGIYKLLVVAKNKKGKPINNQRIYTLGSHFDKLKIENDRSQAQMLMPLPQIQGQQFNAENMIATITGIVVAVTPLISVLKPLFPVKDSTSMDKMMFNNMSMMNGIMKNNMLENVSLFKRMQDEIMELKQEPGETETPLAMILFEKFAPMLGDFIPKILGGGVQGDIITGMIKGAKEFKELSKNPTEAAALVDLIAEEQGSEKAAALAEALGLNLGDIE